MMLMSCIFAQSKNVKQGKLTKRADYRSRIVGRTKIKPSQLLGFSKSTVSKVMTVTIQHENIRSAK